MFLVSKQNRDLIYFRAKVNLKSEASRTFLSFLWWILEPIMLMATYYVVFAVLLDRGTEDFIPFLLVGLVSWQWFSNSISHSMASITQNTALVTLVEFPKVVLPSINVLVDTFKFAIIFCLLICFLFIYGFQPTVHYLALPLIILTQYFFICTLANLLSGLVTLVPDLSVFVVNMLRLVFYLSGILYAYESLPEQYHIYFQLNPIATFVDSYRDVLMYQRWPEVQLLSTTFLCALVGLVLSTRFLSMLDPLLPRILLQK